MSQFVFLPFSGSFVCLSYTRLLFSFFCDCVSPAFLYECSTTDPRILKTSHRSIGPVLYIIIFLPRGEGDRKGPNQRPR